jgi:hypothetical protein
MPENDQLWLIPDIRRDIIVLEGDCQVVSMEHERGPRCLRSVGQLNDYIPEGDADCLIREPQLSQVVNPRHHCLEVWR